MNIKQGFFGLVLAAGLAGLAGCASETGPSSDAPADASSAAAPEEAASAAGGYGSAAEDAPAGGSETSEDVMVTISEFEYDVPESIAPGATVTVVNEDSAPHTVTAEGDGGFDVEAAAGETVTFTAPEEAGEYEIICTYHPEMSGTLVVQ